MSLTVCTRLLAEIHCALLAQVSLVKNYLLSESSYTKKKLYASGTKSLELKIKMNEILAKMLLDFYSESNMAPITNLLRKISLSDF